MLRHCRGTQRQRLMSKFTENDHEKVDRLLELHFKYLDKVEMIDREVENMEKVRFFAKLKNDIILCVLHFHFKILLRKFSLIQDPDMTEDEFENEIYFRRLEGGLFTLQLIDYIIIEICTNGPPTIKQRVTHILNLRGGSLKTIRQIMRGIIFENLFIL